MALKTLFLPDLINFDLNAKDQAEVFVKLSQQFLDAGVIDNQSAYIDAVYFREKEGVTGIGDGIAIPHGKSPAVLKSAVAIAKLVQPISWPSLDYKLVQYVFLLAVPESGDDDHLRMLSELAVMLMDDDVRDGLIKAQSKAELTGVFTKSFSK